MVFKTITITQGGDPEWHEREGPDPFKPRCHYVMLVVFIIGILAIIAIGVWIGIDLKKSKKDKPTTTVTPVTDRPPTTTTASQTTTRSTTTRATTTAPPTTTNPVTTNRIVRSTVSTGTDVLLALQQAMADPSRVKMSTFTNWDLTTTVDDLYVATPQNHTEIQALVKVANQNGLQLRAIGSGMSYSNLFPDSGHVMLDLSDFKYRHDGKMYAVNDSFEEFPFATVSVAAGVTQEDLVPFMVDNNVQLNTMGSSFGITIGGAISTATHGTAPNEATMSDFVVGVQYIDSEGEMRSASISTPEDISRIRCCIGLCGIIYDITLKVDPLRHARLTQGFSSGVETVQNTTYLTEMMAYSGYEMFFAPLSSLNASDWEKYQSTGDLPDSYDPWMDQWWWRTIEDVPATVSTGNRRRKRSAGDVELSPLMAGILLDGELSNATTTITQQPTKYTSLLVHKWAYDYTVGLVNGARSADALASPFPELAVHINQSLLQKTYSFNFLIPDNSELTTLKRACEITFNLTKQYLSRGVQPYLTVEIRWIKPSPSCVLCPGAFADASRVMTFEPIGASSKAEYFTFMTQLLSEFRLEWPEVRLHWAKFYEAVPGVKELIKTTMSEQLQAMHDTTNNVAFRDLFTTELLQGFVN